ncbi:MAG: Rdx family protein [Planctomycetes bacterium]|nr:Rdx family protein [Planctomycetota bacterium]
MFVDGELIASRGGKMLKRLLGGGFPDPEEVIEKIEALQLARGKSKG